MAFNGNFMIILHVECLMVLMMALFHPGLAVTSLPFAPEIVLPVIEHCIYELKLKMGNRYGFKATFNQTFHNKSFPSGWISPWHFGINQGPIVLMTENYRTGLLWSLMKKCPYIINGLKRAGFTGGYLSNKKDNTTHG